MNRDTLVLDIISEKVTIIINQFTYISKRNFSQFKYFVMILENLSQNTMDLKFIKKGTHLNLKIINYIWKI